ncbi:MAG: toxin [Actinobacteria bacterium]|nr:toxin [Actinomycetota bacterium]
MPPPPGQAEDRLIYLGDDEEGVPLEVMAVELGPDELYVIHAMPLREKYRRQYEEARKWRT